MSTLRIKTATTTEATTYTFRFEGYGSWASFTLNPRTGELNIQSDWGNYAYRWHVDQLGQSRTFEHFLVKCQPDYLVRKLAKDGDPRLADEVDQDATYRALLKRVDEKFPESSDLKELLLEQLEDWCATNFEDWPSDDLCVFLETPMSHVLYRPSHRYEFLRDTLIPTFLDWLRERQPTEQHPAQVDA